MGDGEQLANGNQAKPKKPGFYERHVGKGKAVIGVGVILGAMWTFTTDLQKMVIKNDKEQTDRAQKNHEKMIEKFELLNNTVSDTANAYTRQLARQGIELYLSNERISRLSKIHGLPEMPKLPDDKNGS